MEKSSDINRAYLALSICGARAPLLAIMEELVKDQEAVVLESNSADPKLAEKLIKSQERRFLLELFRAQIK